MFELNRKDGDADRGNRRQAGDSRTAQGGEPAARQRTDSSQFAVIGRSIQISGDVKGDEDLMIEGDVSGTVELKNHALTVGKEGKVKANISARSITVDGTTDGDLFASERIAIRASADVRGNLLAPRISIEDGAHFKGSVEMDQVAVDKVLGTERSKPSTKPESVTARPIGNTKPAVGQQTAANASR